MQEEGQVGVVTLREMISLALHLMYALFVYLCYIHPLFLVSPSPGGICERYQTFSGGMRKTLNTGIVSMLNYGRRVPTGVSALTFAHEAGHSFGSPVCMEHIMCSLFYPHTYSHTNAHAQK